MMKEFEQKLSFPFVPGDLVIVQKNFTSDDKAPDYYLARVDSIILEETGEEPTPKQYEFEPILKVVSKHFKGKNNTFSKYYLYPAFVVGYLDYTRDLVTEVDELLSLNLANFNNTRKEDIPEVPQRVTV